MVAPIRTEPLARLLDQLVRTLHAKGHSEGLFPAQWAALRYFVHAPANKRTAMDLARYQGIAFGSVSRSVRTLVDKGYAVKAGSAGRGRAERIDLTDLGRRLLEEDPLLQVQAALSSLSDADRKAMGEGISRIVAALQTGIDGDPLETTTLTP